MQCSDKYKIKEFIESNLMEKRRIHTYAVVRVAKELAERYGEDIEKAEIAALFHDIFRGVSKEKLNEYVRRLGLDQVYINNCNLAHGKIAAFVMEMEYGIHDKDIINAVSYHTTGREHMSRLEKIIYIADAIEPNRIYPDVDELRYLAFQNLDEACLESLNRTIDYIIKQGLFLDHNTVMARDSLLKEIKRKEIKNE